MHSVIKLGILVCLLAFLDTSARVFALNQKRSLELFPVTGEPSKQEWASFFALSQAQMDELWKFHSEKGRKLKDWGWQWRIAWVRKCQEKSTELCSRILSQALADPAMVVRSESVDVLAERFESAGQAAEVAIDLLEQSYLHPFNERNEKPMFIHFRILAALAKIGSPKASTIATRLASKYPDTKKYWSKITTAKLRSTDASKAF